MARHAIEGSGALDAETLGLFLAADWNAGDLEAAESDTYSARDVKCSYAFCRRGAGKIKDRDFRAVRGIGNSVLCDIMDKIIITIRASDGEAAIGASAE